MIILSPIIGYAEGQPLPGFRTLRLFEYGAGFFAAVIMLFVNYFRTSSLKTRQQMRIVLISCLTALIPVLVLNILPQAIWQQPAVPPGFSILFVAFIPAGMGYAIVTQKLMDIDVVIRRSIIYGLITLIMALVLSAGIVLALAFEETLGLPGEIGLALILGGIATLLFGPAKKAIEFLVDKYLYKDRYDYRQIIQSLSISLNNMKEFSGISRLIVGTTVNTLNLAGGCLFVKSQSGSFEMSVSQGTLTNNNTQKELLDLVSNRSESIAFPNPVSPFSPELAFIVPLRAGDTETGILCLSQKLSRQSFSPDDIFLIQEISTVGAMSLLSSMLIRDVSIRDTFVSIASHELRTPLTVILGYAELLIRKNPSESTRVNWLQNILNNGQKVSAMVDDLLNVSRIQSGKTIFKLEKTSVLDMLNEELTLARERTDKHEFIWDVEPDLPDITADHDKLSHIISNLLSNAVKYSPDGGKIVIKAYEDFRKHRVTVCISDEGIGINDQDKESLFSTFHRIQRPETQGIRGTGLGLYIAREWTEAMAGEIWFESELNKGSTFYVSFPVWEKTKSEETAFQE